ncbi:Uncharacterised protein [Mycobacterium tuberculosis]|uniref:Uncharacterized protein n=1 Tax=Mycobacterium tuberculosis TaxID=1773 RepID=A0A916LF77_MYCTX|nr:Uncharacterised protein [Mycobacterium tuberculosis]CPA06787.1 Uncharacterised protein [Mycobacterium tuberculosis]
MIVVSRLIKQTSVAVFSRTANASPQGQRQSTGSGMRPFTRSARRT